MHLNGAVHSEPYVWYVVALLFIVSVVNYMDRMALSVLAPFIQADFNLSDSQLGLLTGFAFSLLYALCGIPIAWWADQGNRRNIIALALTTWSVMTALSGTAQNFWHLFAARVGVGVGEAGSYPSAQSILCDYVPLKRRPGVFAINTFGNFVGLAAGLILAGWLGELIGWRWTFVALGIPGIALALVIRYTLREPVRGFFDGVQEERRRTTFTTTLGVLWRCSTYRTLVSFLVIAGFFSYGLFQWWPTFYIRVHGMSSSTVGVYLGLAIGAGSGIGALAGGILANKVGDRDSKLPLKIAAAAVLAAFPAVVASLFSSSASLSIALGLGTVLLISLPSGPVFANVYSVIPSHMRAMAGATTILLSSAFGYGLGPLVVGLLSDRLAPSLASQSLRYALIAPVCLLPIQALLLARASATVVEDLRTIGERSQDDGTRAIG